MNKIILSLLLISIAFVGIGAAAASDVVSDVANPNVISLEDPNVISLEDPNVISLGDPNVISCDRPQMDRPFYTISSDRPQMELENPNVISSVRPFYTAEDIYNVPIVGQDVNPFDGDYFHPIQPVDLFGPYDPKL